MARPDPVAPSASPEAARDVPATPAEKKAAVDEKNVAAGSAADASREAQTTARLAEEQRQLGAAQAPPREGERAERSASSAPVASPPAAARAKAAPDLAKKSAVPAASPADVEGRLGVADRPAARRALVELAARLGGTAVPGLADARGDVVDLLVPAAAYPELVAGLARLGRWAPVREPAALSGQVRVSLLLTD
jgi:hypothetical protein